MGKTKDEYLVDPVQHIDFKSFDSTKIIDSMSHMGFSSRELANATRIYKKMLQDEECVVILSLAGSTSAAGCMHVYSEMVRLGMVDAIVATGASIVDMDFFEALGFRHYIGSSFADDCKLRDLKIDRIYDTYIDEENLQKCDEVIYQLANSLEPQAYSSREFIREMGKFLNNSSLKKDNSLVELAYMHNVPIFCPAFSDCSAGFGLVKHQIRNPEAHLTIDSVKDFKELTELKMCVKNTGLLIIGGGVPKNFVQDTVVCAELLGKEVPMHKYAVQITVADVRDGACSSSTLKEAGSWGKVSVKNEQMVYAEASTVVPLMASYIYHNVNFRNRARRNLSKLFKND